MALTFGWYGFRVDHPEDWAPVAVSGNRREGYVRLGSPGRLSLQIRWKSLGANPDLTLFLKDYFSRLRRDANRSRATFDAEESTDESVLTYGYRGVTFGRGQIRQGACGRVFVLEVASTQNDSLKAPLRLATQTFESGCGAELWSVLGLRMQLPFEMEVEKREFLAGKTRLFLRSKHGSIVAERWAFADQLLRAHPMADWAKAVLATERADVMEENEGLRLRWLAMPWRIPAEALVRCDADANQLTVLSVKSRDAAWRPNWDWLTL